MKRICTLCKIQKPLERFVKQSGKYRKDPYTRRCKDCKNYRRREKIKILEQKSWNRGTGKGRRCVNDFKWKYAVLERDKYECQKCGKKDTLQCHHIIPWKENISLRFDVSNGLTLCRSCHMSLESKLRAEKGDSEETKKRKSEAQKGKIAWNKGIPRTEEEKKNQSEKMKGKPSYWKGKKIPRESVEKMRKKLIGRIPWNKGLKKNGKNTFN